MSLAYLNGEFLPVENAQVSALDRGFLFGDGVYEVIAFYHGNGAGTDDHLQRLDNSLHAVGIKAPLTHEQWHTIFARLLPDDQNNYKIYLQITRGTDVRRDFSYPSSNCPATVFAYSSPFTSGRLDNGCKTISLEDTRWHDCYIKSINLLPSVMSTEIAKRHNCEEAILHRHGELTEGASSNVFVVKEGTVLTTPVSPNILNGITRQIVLDILSCENIPHAEANIPLTSLYSADEIWLTSSTREIAPVIELDSRVIADGKPGKLWQRINKHYQQRVTRGE